MLGLDPSKAPQQFEGQDLVSHLLVRLHRASNVLQRAASLGPIVDLLRRQERRSSRAGRPAAPPPHVDLRDMVRDAPEGGQEARRRESRNSRITDTPDPR
jgi:hypothetical protein